MKVVIRLPVIISVTDEAEEKAERNIGQFLITHEGPEILDSTQSVISGVTTLIGERTTTLPDVFTPHSITINDEEWEVDRVIAIDSTKRWKFLTAKYIIVLAPYRYEQVGVSLATAQWQAMADVRRKGFQV